MTESVFKEIETSLGTVRCVATEEALIGVYLGEQDAEPPDARAMRSHPVLDLAILQLQEYFAGERRSFSVPLASTGTAFQQSVWRALRAIPYGETRSYSELATAIGNPRAARAVGAANGRNPLGIVVPCHRVIGASGKLTGYAGGLANKQWLLEHERHHQIPLQ